MRIVSYNIQGGLGMDGKRSTPRIADTVRALLPDVICFQEVHQKLLWSGSEDQPVVLANRLQRPFVFFAPRRFGFGGEGLGICVRGAVSEEIQHQLPSGRENRGVLEARLRDVGGFRSLTVLCAHWGLDSGERLEQAAECVKIITKASRPLLLCGDFNETADSPAVRHLISGSGLLDAGAASNLPTFPADNPTNRIDFILYSPDLRLISIETIPSLASDHLPLSADFEKA